MTPSNPPGRLWPWLIAQLGLAALLGWVNRGVLNHDAIAYMRIAEYCAAGDTERMISGYWGPLFSWLIALGIKTGLAPEISARLAMGLAAAIFLKGSAAYLQAMTAPAEYQRRGLAACTLGGALWSAQNLTPDLLMAGLAVWAMANQQAGLASSPMRAVTAGLLWGLAYLAKPVALPWAVLVTVAMVWFDGWRNRSAWRTAMIAGAVLTMVAGPWIGVISKKYGHWTISTSGPIAHALAGPADVMRYHPTFVTLHHPDAGRITSWEDPTGLGYRRWSPFASGSNLRHQFSVIGLDSLRVLFILSTLVPVWPWILARAFRNKDPRSDVWRSLIPVGLLAGLYLPFYLTANEQRYFLVALPLLWGALAAGGNGLGATNDEPGQTRGLWISFTLVVLVAVASHVRFSVPPRMASRDARDVAGWLEDRNLSGPVAGSALQRGGRTGLFLAWHLRQPWLGDDPAASAGSLAASGARLVVLTPKDPLLDSLAGRPSVRRLDLPGNLGDRIALFEMTDSLR